MDFKLTRIDDPARGTVIRFEGEVTARDIVRLPLNALDRALMDQPDVADPLQRAADHLLTLEMLFRRNAQRVSEATRRGAAEASRV